MKKLILALVIACGFVGVAVADEVATKFADGVVGTEDQAYRVKSIIFNCNSELDAVAATSSRNARPCYGVLWDGDTNSGVSGVDTPKLHFQATITSPTVVIDYAKLVNAGTMKPGVLFTYGIYYDEVTGSTAVTVVYEPK
jgi:hypothetical protein